TPANRAPRRTAPARRPRRARGCGSRLGWAAQALAKRSPGGRMAVAGCRILPTLGPVQALLAGWRHAGFEPAAGAVEGFGAGTGCGGQPDRSCRVCFKPCNKDSVQRGAVALSFVLGIDEQRPDVAVAVAEGETGDAFI